MPYFTSKPVSSPWIALFVFFIYSISNWGWVTPIGLPFFSVTSRPSDPGVVKLLPSDWESHFFFFCFLNHSFLGLVKKKKLIGFQYFLFLCRVLQERNKGLIRPRELIITGSLRNYQLHILKSVELGWYKWIPIQEEEQLISSWEDVLYSEEKPDLQNIRLIDPDQFVEGGLHRNPEAWDRILVDHPQKDTIGYWIRNKIETSKFTQHAKALIRVNTTAQISRRLNNLVTTLLAKRFQVLFLREILKRLTTGALRVWGRVGDDSPPYLVLSLTVEPTNLCMSRCWC